MVGKHLGHDVRTARMKSSLFALWLFQHLAEHFRTGGLEKPRLRRMLAQGFQDPQDAHTSDVSRKHWLLPGNRHKALRGEIINFIRLQLLNGCVERTLVSEV